VPHFIERTSDVRAQNPQVTLGRGVSPALADSDRAFWGLEKDMTPKPIGAHSFAWRITCG